MADAHELKPLTEQQQKLFERLCEVARNKERCPTNEQLKVAGSTCTPADIAKLGYIRIEIYAGNWRVVTILTGPDKGCSTAPPEKRNARKPYRVIDHNGDSNPSPGSRKSPPVSLGGPVPWER